MSDALTTQGQQEGQLVSQDTTQVLQRIFTGHLVAAPATGTQPQIATVTQVTSINSRSAVIVQLGGFGVGAGWACYFEPCYYWNGSANVAALPPAGTQCVVCFPSNEPQNIGFVIGFFGWPTE